MTRNALTRLLAGLATIVLAAACTSPGGAPAAAGVAVPDATTSAGQAAGTSAATAAGGTAGPTAGAVTFTGHATCIGGTKPAPSNQPEAGNTVCTLTASDPRMAGTLDGFFVVSGTDTKVASLAGSGTLTNDGGWWQCSQFGLGSMEPNVGFLDTACEGRDAYVGLRGYMHGLSTDNAGTWTSFGWIEKSF